MNRRAAFAMAVLACASIPAPGAGAPGDDVEAVEAIEDWDFDDEDYDDDYDPFALTADDLRRFGADGDAFEFADIAPDLDRWRTSLKRALAGGDLARASRQLAREFDLTPKAMRELARLWLISEINEYAFDDGSEEAARFRAEMLDARASAGHTRLTEQIAADAIGRVTECDVPAFETIVAGSPDAVASAWSVVNLATCSEGFTWFAQRFPERSAAALLGELQWGALDDTRALPLYSWLGSERGLAHVAEADRANVHAWLARRFAGELVSVGLEGRAAALVDGLPAAVRERAFVEDLPAFVATVDGLTVSFDADDAGGIGLSHAITKFMTGHPGEAERILAALPDLALSRRAFDCRWDPHESAARPDGPCADDRSFRDVGVYPLILDRLLHDPGADPYPLAEVGFSGGIFEGGTSHPEMLCRFFAEPQYASICDNARRGVLYAATLDPERYDFDEGQRIAEAIEALRLPGWEAHRDAFAADLAAVRERYAAYGGDSPWRRREAVDPVTPPFAEQPLPEDARTSAERRQAEWETERGWPAGWEELPLGFFPVRWEAAGGRAIAVSVSPLLDPSGEVSAGGYWVHLSDDGGKTWRTPRYTGLAEHFPYVVPPTSKLPLLDGDTLRLEVEVAEIDTRSISYPPVALATRRRAKDLFLEIPLAALERDGDDDGITDLVESHLLLDRAGTGGAPFVIGTDPDERCAGADPALIGLRAQVLLRVTGQEERAIIEPVDRRPADALVAGWRRAETGLSWPLYLKGDRAEFACLPANGRLMLVFDEAQEAELQRRTPDFRLLEFPRLVMNRERTRGYVIWSAGWTGGTLRALLVDGEWQLVETSSWIT